jgi:cysteinyl-tRNA synthetase
MISPIKIYNTKSKQIESFKALSDGKIGIYSCGPTVYHYAHIGNLRAYVFADVLRRMFIASGYKVNHVINITDVGHMTGDGDDGEDKLEKGAARVGKNVWEVAKIYTDAFFEDLTALNIPLTSYTFPRATDHIQEQLALISALEIAGHTYTISDGVYFDTATFPSYADFAHLDVEGLKSGARVEENKEKRNITDFALWKFSPKNDTRQMEWESTWGKGFPGWHIECSAMSMKYLGEHFDIHTGGIDHIPVHHTNEIAQSESVTGTTYANYWMHVNFLNDKEGKMSKSNDEFLRLKVLLDQGYPALSYRYYLLTVHYRSSLDFSFENLEAQKIAYKKLVAWCASHVSESGSIDKKYADDFKEAMHNDVGTPQAIAIIWTLLKDETVSDNDTYATILSFDTVLGLDLKYAEKEKDMSNSPDIKELIALRDTARAQKNYEESDRLRKTIEEKGYIVKDTQGGTEVTTGQV